MEDYEEIAKRSHTVFRDEKGKVTELKFIDLDGTHKHIIVKGVQNNGSSNPDKKNKLSS